MHIAYGIYGEKPEGLCRLQPTAIIQSASSQNRSEKIDLSYFNSHLGISIRHKSNLAEEDCKSEATAAAQRGLEDVEFQITTS